MYVVVIGSAALIVNYNINGAPATVTLNSGGTATITVNAATVNQTFNFVSISNGPCTNPSSGSATATILPLPVANAGLDQTVCAGSPVTLNALSTQANTTYTWNNGVTNATPFTSVNVANSAPITTTYTLTATVAVLAGG